MNTQVKQFKLDLCIVLYCGMSCLDLPWTLQNRIDELLALATRGATKSPTPRDPRLDLLAVENVRRSLCGVDVGGSDLNSKCTMYCSIVLQ
jgi:hypothetical protein